MKTVAIALTLLLGACVRVVYPYEYEAAIKACQSSGGVHRIEWGPRGPAVYCNNGSYHYPALP